MGTRESRGFHRETTCDHFLIQRPDAARLSDLRGNGERRSTTLTSLSIGGVTFLPLNPCKLLYPCEIPTRLGCAPRLPPGRFAVQSLFY